MKTSEQQLKSEINQMAVALQPDYSSFRVADRILFTGHSHQAWPDCAFEGIREYQDVVTSRIDAKWGAAFEKTEILREYLRGYYNDPDGLYCREANTHILLSSWISSLDLQKRPKIISTTGEFHSMYRQLQSLKKWGVHVEFVEANPMDELPGRISALADDKTAAVFVSRVYFESSEINTGLQEIIDTCREVGAYCMVDDYHGTNVVPLSIREEGWEDLFILIGGYKYLQWGEGNCFLRFPKDYPRFPVLTGWFSSFGSLSKQREDGVIEFDTGDQRFASATYDPISQFRAAKVAEYFIQKQLTPDRLRSQYLALTEYLRNGFRSLGMNPAQIRLQKEAPVSFFGGFVSLESPKAREISSALMERGVFTDARGSILRLGPAPYTTTDQCDVCLKIVSEVTDQLFTEAP